MGGFRLRSCVAVVFCVLSGLMGGAGRASAGSVETSCQQLIGVTQKVEAQFFPFEKFPIERLEPMFLTALDVTRARIKNIVSNSEPPTFENTVLELLYADAELERVETALYIYKSNVSTPEIQGMVERLAPLRSDLSVEIFTNEDLFKRVEAVYNARERFLGEDLRLVEEIYKGFKKSGVSLPPESKASYKADMRRLSELQSSFNRNLLNSKAANQWNIQEESLLDGVPLDIIQNAKVRAEKAGLPGYLINHGTLGVLMEYANSSAVREKAYFLLKRAGSFGEYDNKPLVLEISRLRRRVAQLLGSPDYATNVLVDLMAGGVQNVRAFLKQVFEDSYPVAKAEFDEYRAMKLAQEGTTELKPWDVAYYSRLAEQKKFQFDEQLLRPYFELSRVQNGFFELAHRLYGVSFKPLQGVSTWHPDVEVFEVTNEDGSLVGHVYMDFFARDGAKSGGAWSQGMMTQHSDEAVDSRPSVLISMNIQRDDSGPTLLTPSEVETYFHEMGHAMHGLFSKVKYATFAGTSVAWDFVELPSQVMERFYLERSVLDTFARHHETGERIPDELYAAFKRAKTGPEGGMIYASARMSSLDLDWHSLPLTEDATVEGFEYSSIAPYLFVSLPREQFIPHSQAFAHIFEGGYASKYYSYLWSQMLDADVLQFMRQNGLVNREVGGRLRRLLEQGGSRPASDLYQEFMGRPPSPAALKQRIVGSN